MKRNRILLCLGLILMGIFVLFALFPDAFAPYGAKEMWQAWQPPGANHILGTNDMGYDIFSELVFSARSTLAIGLAAALISLLVGSSIGLAAGYLPGWKGEIAGGVIQVFLMIPMLPMAIVIAAFLGTETRNIIIIIAALGWCATARTVRVRTMQLKQSSFVESLMILGISKWQIMTRHILPNLREVILSRYIMTVAQAIMLEATLSFLGMGNPTEVTWGRMINIAYKRGGFTRGAYNWLISPGICIALVVIAFYCINQYLEAHSSEVSGVQSYMD
jgi:ABC-type dipeptide/oligopeptide/nickel transport systems, permease components